MLAAGPGCGELEEKPRGGSYDRAVVVRVDRLKLVCKVGRLGNRRHRSYRAAREVGMPKIELAEGCFGYLGHLEAAADPGDKDPFAYKTLHRIANGADAETDLGRNLMDVGCGSRRVSARHDVAFQRSVDLIGMGRIE